MLKLSDRTFLLHAEKLLSYYDMRPLTVCSLLLLFPSSLNSPRTTAKHGKHFMPCLFKLIFRLSSPLLNVTTCMLYMPRIIKGAVCPIIQMDYLHQFTFRKLKSLVWGCALILLVKGIQLRFWL